LRWKEKPVAKVGTWERRVKKNDASNRRSFRTLWVSFFLPFFAYLASHFESSKIKNYHAASASDSFSEKILLSERRERRSKEEKAHEERDFLLR